MSKVVRVELSGGKGTYCELDLPASDYQLLDALERLNMEAGERPAWEVLEYHDYDFMVPFLDEQGDFYELNALMRKLSELDIRQGIAFEGLVQMESDKQKGAIQLPRLLDLAYSTDCCQVADALNDSQLGRFYAENGFLPKMEKVPDKFFELLDFERLGREARLGECGVFTSHGYVVQDSDLERAPQGLDIQPSKPDYVFRVGIRCDVKEEMLKKYEKVVYLDLPVDASKFGATLNELASRSGGELSLISLDGPLTSMDHDLFYMEELPLLYDLAKRIRQIDADGKLPKYKALLCAQDCHDIRTAILLTDTVDNYYFSPELRSPEEAAREELDTIVSGKDAELLAKHLNLYAYGQDVLARDNAVLTDYGLLVRQDGQPIQSQQESPSPGMTMT